jgi:hypothetical protein
MAIHPDHPGLEVHVAVNDQPLREYEDEDAIADTKTITRYIEVRAGDEFQIWYRFSKPFPDTRDIGVDCFVDGALVRKPRHSRSELIRQSFRVIRGTKAEEELKWVVRAIRFIKLNIGEFLLSSTPNVFHQ